MANSLFNFGGNKNIKPAVDAYMQAKAASLKELTPQEQNERANAHLEKQREEIRRNAREQNSSSSHLRNTLGNIAAIGDLSNVLAQTEPSFAHSASLAAAASELTSRLPLDDPYSETVTTALLQIQQQLQAFYRTLDPLAENEPVLADTEKFQIIQQGTAAAIKRLHAIIGERTVAPAPSPATENPAPTDTIPQPTPTLTPMQDHVAKTRGAFSLVQDALPTMTLMLLEAQATAMAEDSPTMEHLQLVQKIASLRGSASTIGKLATKSAFGMKAEPLVMECNTILTELEILLQDGLIESVEAPIVIPMEDIQQLLSSPMTDGAVQEISKCRHTLKKAQAASREPQRPGNIQL